jgi:hypothetical protein
MKGKVLTLIIGILIGAIIATAGFLIYNKVESANQPDMMQMDGNGQGQMGDPSNGSGQMGGQNGDMSEPPEKPDGDNSEEPPTKPDESSNS